MGIALQPDGTPVRLLALVAVGQAAVSPPSPTPANQSAALASDCSDASHGARDAKGRGCEWYGSRDDVAYYCYYRGYDDADADFTPVGMCCACDICLGGRKLVCPGEYEQNPCLHADVFSPPSVNEQGKVDVNISLVWMDLESIDERSGTVTMRADIQMWWRDCRWSWMLALIHRTADGCLDVEPIRAAMSKISGSTAAWSEAGNSVRNAFTKSTQRDWLNARYDPRSTCFADNAVEIWNPVPPQLRLLTSTSTQSRSDSDVHFRSEQEVEPGAWSALIKDNAEIKFAVSMRYMNFPFDEQVLDIRLEFDSIVNATIVRDIQTGKGDRTYAESVNLRSQREYVASEASFHTSQTAIESFSMKGFNVRAVDVYIRDVGEGCQVYTTITIDRKWQIIFFRFFFPLIMLTFIPFAGFFLPVHSVMPRVATGFISFLTLTVFRDKAYDMVPKVSSSWIWVDVVMITLTEIVWGAVMQNVVAQVVNKTLSLYAACQVDNTAKAGFIGLWSFELILLFATGMVRLRPSVVLWMAQLSTLACFAFMIFRVAYIMRHIDQILLNALAKQLMNTRALWHEPIQLEPREIDLVFRWIDNNVGDKSGDITIDECIAGLKANGMVFKKGFEAEREQEMTELMEKALGRVTTPESQIGMDEFRKHFDGLMGAGIAKARAVLKHDRDRASRIEAQEWQSGVRSCESSRTSRGGFGFSPRPERVGAGKVVDPPAAVVEPSFSWEDQLAQENDPSLLRYQENDEPAVRSNLAVTSEE